ncbi:MULTISPECIES: DUF6672 family protein [unclassified Pyramidobacter]|uniref:DUF6672 family protein n=1 Tax=unclassified Pyramidobacter TaxID=2632171 RepID=UPI000EA2A58F|nr:DUF6672 family protein [Pyramidobacter sp. CG50-2]RKJ80708.1 transmembrane BAX inhibitor motif protein-containing protein 1 [Pyramidobacter sp. CG50-2]
MKMKRILVNLAIVLIFTALGWYCYDRGKAYDFLVENTAYTGDGQVIESMEAVQVSIDSREGKILYADDRDQAVAIGSGTHKARIDVLDMDDKPIEGQSRIFTFKLSRLGKKPVLNIPLAYKNGDPAAK